MPAYATENRLRLAAHLIAYVARDVLSPNNISSDSVLHTANNLFRFELSFSAATTPCLPACSFAASPAAAGAAVRVRRACGGVANAA